MVGYKYDTTEPKLPLEVYTVYMEWKSKEPVPVIETFEDEICGGQINEPLPKRFSTKCSGILVASAIAEKWLEKGFSVKIYQTINMLNFNSDKEMKK